VPEPNALFNAEQRLELGLQVEVLRDTRFAIDLIAASGLGGKVDPISARLHLARFRNGSGLPTDPVERFLLDLLALARVRVGRVAAQAELAGKSEVARIYLSAFNQLVGAACNTVSTLAAYRASPRPFARYKADLATCTDEP